VIASLVDSKTQAWNNFVLNCDPDNYEVGTERRAASLAAEFMGLTNNGGFNSYLTASSDRDAKEVLASLRVVGANKAAAKLSLILDDLGVELPVMSQDERWDILDAQWNDDLDEPDFLDGEQDSELVSVLEAHVEQNVAHYLARG